MSTAAQQQLMMMSAIQALTHNSTVQREREDSRKSMLSTFDDDTAKLFQYLSAEDWDDESPQLSEFMTKLLQDKSAAKALHLIQSKTRRWEGKICKAGILNFLAQGFLANPSEDRPTGFNIFIHHPTDETLVKTPKERQNQILAMFGESEINDETAKHYADTKLYISTNLDDFRRQLDTCIQSIDLFTNTDSIAGDGYRELAKTIRRNPRCFREFFRADPLFGIKLGALVDKVFQDFVEHLLDNVSRTSPIRSARRALEFQQEDTIKQVFSQISLGITPALALPRSWSPSEFNMDWRTPSLPPITRPDGVPPPFKEPPAKAGTIANNTSPKREWMLPSGKSFGQFFNSKDPAQTPNLKGWPELMDPRTGKKAEFCIKFHVVGRCKAGCYLSHAPVAQIPAADITIISTKLKKIFGH
jgi:hypothetical protein